MVSIRFHLKLFIEVNLDAKTVIDIFINIIYSFQIGEHKLIKLEYYVLNYDWNAKKVVLYNIFNNVLVYESTLTEVKKYLRAPNKYVYIPFNGDPLYGFEAFVEKLSSTIRWQEWGRREYEISVGDAFENDLEKLEKWDCWQQCKPNISIIAREVIHQYKDSLK